MRLPFTPSYTHLHHPAVVEVVLGGRVVRAVAGQALEHQLFEVLGHVNEPLGVGVLEHLHHLVVQRLHARLVIPHQLRAVGVGHDGQQVSHAVDEVFAQLHVRVLRMRLWCVTPRRRRSARNRQLAAHPSQAHQRSGGSVDQGAEEAPWVARGKRVASAVMVSPCERRLSSPSTRLRLREALGVR